MKARNIDSPNLADAAIIALSVSGSVLKKVDDQERRTILETVDESVPGLGM